MTKIAVFLILLGFSTNSLGNISSRYELRDRNRQVLLDTVRSYIGVRETTGNNDGPIVKKFLASTNLPEGPPWCAAYVTYCHKVNGIPYPAKAPAWSPSWFPASRIIPKEKGLAGDVFGIYYSNLGRIAHVGFLDEDFNKNPKSTTIITVEGNTNSDGVREGDGVHRKRRNKKQIYRVSRWL